MRQFFTSRKQQDQVSAFKRDRQNEEVRRQHDRWTFGQAGSSRQTPIFPIR